MKGSIFSTSVGPVKRERERETKSKEEEKENKREEKSSVKNARSIGRWVDK
jgi:hypothetical protein